MRGRAASGTLHPGATGTSHDWLNCRPPDGAALEPGVGWVGRARTSLHRGTAYSRRTVIPTCSEVTADPLPLRIRSARARLQLLPVTYMDARHIDLALYDSLIDVHNPI